MKRPIYIIIAAVVVGAVAYLAYAQMHKPMDMAKQTDSNTAATPAGEIDIVNYEFKPSPMTIKVGDTVTWKNTDVAKHTLTKDDGSSDGPDSQLIGKGETYTYTFKTAGTYKYHCDPHPYMHGEIIVTN